MLMNNVDHQNHLTPITVTNPSEIPEVVAMMEGIRKAEPEAEGMKITVKHHPQGFGTVLLVSEGLRGGAWNACFIGDEDRGEALVRVCNGKKAKMLPLPPQQYGTLAANPVTRKQREKQRRKAEIIRGAKAMGVSVADYLALEAATHEDDAD